MPELKSRQLPAEGGVTLRVASSVIIASFVLAMLYLGRVVLEPLAIAVLLAFVLTPPVRRLRRFHFGRVTSVVTVVVFALGVIIALGFVMETQVTRLAGEIPHYQKNLREKIASLNKALVASGTLKQASSTLDSLASELNSERGGSPGVNAGEAAKNGPAAPIPVVVRTPQPATLNYIQDVLSPLIEPVSMAGLLVLFLVFILFYREDLRDRILRLGGTRDLQRTTAAMNDAGKRLSRFFLIQAAINASFGVFIGAALWMIGVPNAVLWGMLAAVLRFVPYVGTPIAAVFPLVLASAVDPGWTKVLETAALFFCAELITGQAIEPVLQGQQTGLSPVAIVLAQLFWTLIWGVPGLLLAVPITVCIAVLGRHVEGLNFLGVVLGDEPALAPHEGFYQRVLAGDATEAAFQAEKQLATETLSGYYDAVPMRALALAEADAARGKLPEDRQFELMEVIEEVIEDLEDYADEAPGKDAQNGGTKGGKNDGQPATAPAPASDQASTPVLLIPARSAIDQAANLLLADLLRKRGLNALVQPYARGKRIVDLSPAGRNAKIICVSCFGVSEAGFVPVRYLIRRWRRIVPGVRFLACFWHLDEESPRLEDMRKTVGADFVATSLKEAARLCRDEPDKTPQPERPQLPAGRIFDESRARA